MPVTGAEKRGTLCILGSFPQHTHVCDLMFAEQQQHQEKRSHMYKNK